MSDYCEMCIYHDKAKQFETEWKAIEKFELKLSLFFKSHVSFFFKSQVSYFLNHSRQMTDTAVPNQKGVFITPVHTPQFDHIWLYSRGPTVKTKTTTSHSDSWIMI